MILTITMNPAIDKVYAVDDFVVGAVFRPRDMVATPGGKGVNVARVAHIIGEQAMATGLLGGSNGNFIRSEIKKQGIIDEFVPIKGQTRICINIIDQKNITSTEILEAGPVISQEEYEDFVKKYEELLDGCDVVTASGSLPKGVPDDFYYRLIEIAREKNKKFILDTSGEYFEEGIKAKPYMIKPNTDELTKVMDGDFFSTKDYVKAVAFFKEQGIELPVLSLGKKGCIAALEDGIYHFTTPSIKVVNTVGSGDSFVAGCAVALAQGKDLKEVIKLGMACGTANTQFFKTGMVSKELVEKFFDRIEYIQVG